MLCTSPETALKSEGGFLSFKQVHRRPRRVPLKRRIVFVLCTPGPAPPPSLTACPTVVHAPAPLAASTSQPAHAAVSRAKAPDSRTPAIDSPTLTFSFQQRLVLFSLFDHFT